MTHGRPDNQKTLQTLQKQGYTGKTYLIVDNEDKTLSEYQKKYDNVIVFDKEDAAKITDRGDTIQKKNVVLFARNMCHKIAKDLDLEYFCELDDDYNTFQYRYARKETLKYFLIDNLDNVFDAYLDLLDNTNALCICMAQTGDFLGGADKFGYELNKRMIRKAMNVYFMRTDRQFKFLGRINEDTNTYVVLGQKGKLFFTYGRCAINQAETQQQAGGLTDSYKENGTYMKSFYSVMMCPSAVKIATMNSLHPRFHHKINWNACAPKIIRQEYKK